MNTVEIQEKDPKWLDPKGFYNRYGFSISRQAALRAKKELPFCRKGHYIRYLTVETDEWLLSYKVV